MFAPVKPSTAGNNVIDASITNATVTDVPRARPWTNETPIRNRPSTEIMTVVPAKTTARPAVSMARTTAGSGASPSWSPWRYRVTMNSA